jgi:glutamate formiminotransferase/formiminotetrahydrofolate cyclodeaminase
MFLAIRTASQLIDLNYHKGEHPRIGATDVVPFVPISDINMQQCVEMARRLGKRVGSELKIPVYLYEEAALVPERRYLEFIRRGQFEALKGEINVLPERAPDFGPSEIGSAGATVIGARQPLIAFNVFLTTNDVRIAQKIAKAIRHSSGGFRFVKAMGVLVEGHAQVSMNLTNYRQSPIGRIVETIRSEARRYGTEIHHSELVGLIPLEALVDAASWYLQMDEFNSEQILEQKIYQTMTKNPQSPPAVLETGFLEQLASGSPTPGGGSAAAQTGATAAALVAMVARLSIGKERFASLENQMRDIIEISEELRIKLQNSVIEDASAFEEYLAASKLPGDKPEQIVIRNNLIEKAKVRSIEIPFLIMRSMITIMDLAAQVAQNGNINAIGDAGSAGAHARAAFTVATYNIKINCANYQDKRKTEEYLTELKKCEELFIEPELRLKTILNNRASL